LIRIKPRAIESLNCPLCTPASAQSGERWPLQTFAVGTQTAKTTLGEVLASETAIERLPCRLVLSILTNTYGGDERGGAAWLAPIIVKADIDRESGFEA